MISSKPKGLFIELSDRTAFLARTSSLKSPLTVEEFKEVSLDDKDGAKEAIREFAGIRQGTYAISNCAVYPTKRVVARGSFDQKKAKKQSYLAEQMSSQFKIDLDQFTVCILDAGDGMDPASKDSFPKDALVCAAPEDELKTAQSDLLEMGIYPESMEIGTVACLGGILNYLQNQEESIPTLVLEIDDDDTNIYVLKKEGIDISRPIKYGINSMIPVVQSELGLKDEASALKLFNSDNFDFTGMGSSLVKKLIRELQASIGFYEVQTGQTVGQLYCTRVPPKMFWLKKTIADMLGVKLLEIDVKEFLGNQNVELSDAAKEAQLDSSWMGLACLMGEYKAFKNEDE